MAKLQIITDTNNKEVIELTRQNYTIGRGDSNSIQLSDTRASRLHAKIYRESGHYYIEDINSSNGIIINKRKLKRNTRYKLCNNDEIQIGNTKIIIKDLSENTSAPSIPEFNEYNQGGMLFDTSEYDLSATLDASRSLAQLSKEDYHDSETIVKAIKRLEAMCIISEAIGNIINIDKLMNKVIDTVFGIFPKADRLFILLKEGDNYNPIAARSRNNPKHNLNKLIISTTVLRTCTTTLTSVLSNNTSKDKRFNSAISIAKLAIKSLICSPLVINNELLGVIQIERTNSSYEFDKTDLQILTGISGQIAIAVKNISLANEIDKESTQRASLQRYFSPNMVEMLINGDINTELGGKSYNGTVFFSDIIGFTAMSEKMKVEDVVTCLNHYLTIMQNIIYKNMGNVDKFGGDAIMAFWSIPKHQKDDEFNAVLTGIQMQIELYSFNLELKHKDLDAIHMGIGINTGSFIAGNIGSEDKIEFTLIGDNVNLAARIEAQTCKTQVICSEETFKLVSSKVTSVKLPKAILKGKSDPLQTYSIRGIEISNGKMLTNIPVRIITNDNPLPDELFILTEVNNNTSGKEVTITADIELSIFDKIKLKCCLNEYHDCIEFTGEIIDATAKEALYGEKYTEYRLNNIQGDKFLEIMTPGFNYKTKLTWEQMPRERKIEGN